MDQEEYEDYLVDKAKEILDEQTSDVEEQEIEIQEETESNDIEKPETEEEKRIPANFDPREIQHLTENRKSMSNREMKEFLERESDLQKELDKIGEWKGFSRWEERFMIQNNLSKEPEEIANELDRDEKQVRLKMRMLGLDVEFQ